MGGDRLRLAYGGLHPDRVATLEPQLGGPAAVLRAIERGRVKVPAAARAAVAVPAGKRRAELTAAGITFLTKSDAGYPEHLAGLPDAPPGLFLRGDLPAVPGVAVVGTRRCTRYGRELAESYGRAIAAAGWVLVSGLALGIDGAAHGGTVAAGGRGVAVLGSGLDVLYPKANTGLAGRLLSGGGAIVSEYPPDAQPLAWRFPPRATASSAGSAGPSSWSKRGSREGR